MSAMPIAGPLQSFTVPYMIITIPCTMVGICKTPAGTRVEDDEMLAVSTQPQPSTNQIPLIYQRIFLGSFVLIAQYYYLLPALLAPYCSAVPRMYGPRYLITNSIYQRHHSYMSWRTVSRMELVHVVAIAHMRARSALQIHCRCIPPET